jgi:predicted transcriptional regulator
MTPPLMSMHGISGIPLMDALRMFAGIISKSDITKAVAHGKALYRNNSSDERKDSVSSQPPSYTNPLE